MKLEKVGKMYKRGEEPDDEAYWETQTVGKKLEAIENLRQQYFAFYCNGVRPEFQGVLRVIKQKRS